MYQGICFALWIGEPWPAANWVGGRFQPTFGTLFVPKMNESAQPQLTDSQSHFNPPPDPDSAGTNCLLSGNHGLYRSGKTTRICFVGLNTCISATSNALSNACLATVFSAE